MKRCVKNIIMAGMIVALAGASFLTWTFIGNDNASTPQFAQSSMGAPPDMNSDGGFKEDNNSNQQPPQMNGGSDNNSQNDNSDNGGFKQDNNSNQQPPQMNGNSGGNSQNGNSDNGGFKQDNNSNQQPPQMNGGSDSNSQNGNSDNGGFKEDNNSNQQPPQMNGGSDSNNQNGNSDNGGFKEDNNSNQQPPQMNGNSGSNSQSGGQFREGMREQCSNGCSVIKYTAIGADSLLISIIAAYLLLSRFNKYGFHETLRDVKRVLIYILCVLVLTSCVTVGQVAAYKTLAPQAASSQQTGGFQPNGNQNGSPQGNNQSASVNASGSTTVSSEQTLSESYSSTNSDESAILVQNGGNATITGAKITKSGDSSNTESSEFYGVNAGILVQKDSTATIKNATISTDAKGANAVFSTGENSKIYISDSTITTTGEGSARGLDATYGGYIEADNVTISTKGNFCATLATDRGEGTVKVTNSKLSTAGAGSPVIYSTGDISITKTTGTATGSQLAVIEGKNKATVTDSTLTASGKGNRGDTDQCGVMIYQSMSGDAGEGTGSFSATDSTLSIDSKSDYYKTAPMFFITNTDAEIDLENTTLNFGSGVLLSAKGTSEWGNSGSNGGNVTFNASKQTLKGDIEIDNISSASIKLSSSTYEGTINGENTAKSVTLKLDKSSKIKLTGDSYITSLENADSSNSNIDFNGYKLYVNGKAVN
ncbi:MAG: hypothetical protein IIU14_06675 [Ruminococcus sp.]|nr:hypothetical protein [Ruminococcus sp.]